MTARLLDQIAASRTYAALVAKFPPRMIRARADLLDTYAVIDRLMSVRYPTPDQLEYLELLSTLVEAHEQKAHPTPKGTLASLLAHLLDAKGISQSQLANETGISASTISDVLAGRRVLSLANIRQLADYFSVDSGIFVNSLVPSSRRRKIAS